MRLARLLFPLFLPVLAVAQGVRYDSNVTTTANNVPAGASAPILTLPNAIVTVCGYPAAPASGAPCTNTVAIFSDQFLTTSTGNPFNSDPKGRFGFWTSPNLLSYSVQTQSGAYVGTWPLSLSSIPGPAGPSGAFTQAGFLSAAAYTGTFAQMMVDASTANSTTTVSYVTPLPNGTTTVSADRIIEVLGGGEFTCPTGVCTLAFSGGDLIGPTNKQIFGTNVVPIGLKVVRPEWLGSTTAGFFVIQACAANTAIPCTVLLNPATYQTGFSPNATSFPTTCMARPNVSIIGAVRPVYAGNMLSLQNGTIIQGGLGVCADNFTMKHVGIDTGYNWTQAGHAADNALVVDGPNWGAETQEYVPPDPILTGLYIENANCLGSAAAALFHCMLIEHTKGAVIKDTQQALDTHCFAFKGEDGIIDTMFARGCGSDGLIIKGDNYTNASTVTASHIVVQYVLPGDTVAGVTIQGAQLTGQALDVHVSDVSVTGAWYGVRFINNSFYNGGYGSISYSSVSDLHVFESAPISGNPAPACILSDSNGSEQDGAYDVGIRISGVSCINATGNVQSPSVPNAATPINIITPWIQSSISDWLNFTSDSAILQGTIDINGWKDFGVPTTYPTFTASQPTISGAKPTTITVESYFSERGNPVSSVSNGATVNILPNLPVTSQVGSADPFTIYNNGTSIYDLAIQNGSKTINNFLFLDTGVLRIPAIKSTTGFRYVCVDENGNLVSQAAACSGT